MPVMRALLGSWLRPRPLPTCCLLHLPPVSLVRLHPPLRPRGMQAPSVAAALPPDFAASLSAALRQELAPIGEATRELQAALTAALATAPEAEAAALAVPAMPPPPPAGAGGRLPRLPRHLSAPAALSPPSSGQWSPSPPPS